MVKKHEHDWEYLGASFITGKDVFLCRICKKEKQKVRTKSIYDGM